MTKEVLAIKSIIFSLSSNLHLVKTTNVKQKFQLFFLTTILLLSAPGFAKQEGIVTAAKDMMRVSYEKLFECFGELPFCKSVKECIQHSDVNEVLKDPAIMSGKITAKDIETCTKAFRKISCDELKKAPPIECTATPPFAN